MMLSDLCPSVAFMMVAGYLERSGRQLSLLGIWSAVRRCYAASLETSEASQLRRSRSRMLDRASTSSR
jgi:hypothetical protein